MRERKKDLKLEFNNLIKDYEHKKYQLNELEQENVNVTNENQHLKSEINELKEQISSIIQKNIFIKIKNRKGKKRGYPSFNKSH